MDILDITDNALNRFKSILEDKPEKAIRVSIKGGGCSGFLYDIDIDNKEPTQKDNVLEKDGITILIDRKSSIFLNGTKIDYTESIMQTGFVFENPQAKAECGCGVSFSVK